MSSGLTTTHPHASVPEIGPWVPTASLRLLFLVVAAGQCVLVLESPFWMAVGLTLAVAGTLVPTLVPTWWLVLLLAISQFWREPSPKDFVYYLLLSGVHLLYLLGGFIRLLPWTGRMQVGALARPLQRFVLVQMVVQGVAVGALSVFARGPGTVRGLSILAAVALCTLAVVLALGLHRAKAET